MPGSRGFMAEITGPDAGSSSGATTLPETTGCDRAS